MKKQGKHTGSESGITVRVWGLAAGCGSTETAAPGAFTWQAYPSRNAVPRQDWRVILMIEAATR